jgi:hypothetical protein
MIVFSCDGLNCSAQIRIEPDNDKNGSKNIIKIL